MASEKPAVVIVHGAWHVPSSYDKLAAALRLAGYEVHVPRLTSMSGTKPPDGDLVSDTAQVRSCAEQLVEAGRAVVALMHSYGGQVGTNALHGLSSRARAKQGLAGGVSGLVYLCGFMLPEGWSAMDQAQSRGIEDANALALKLNLDGGGNCSMAAPREQLVNGVSDDAQAAAYVSTLVSWNLKCMTQPISHCAWKEIPVMYIHTTYDKTLVLASQQLMVERVKESGLQDPLLVTVDTDHCPHLTATQEVVDAFEKTVKAVREDTESNASRG